MKTLYHIPETEWRHIDHIGFVCQSNVNAGVLPEDEWEQDIIL